MSLFKTNYNEDHYDSSVMGTLIASGWGGSGGNISSKWSSGADRTQKTVRSAEVDYFYKYGANLSNRIDNTIQFLVLFRNDNLRFGLVVEDSLTVDGNSPLANAGPQTWDGVFVKGNLNLSDPAANVRLAGQPLLVQGNFTGGPNTTLLAGTTMYYRSLFNPGGGIYLGPSFNYVPPLVRPPVDLSYYLMHRTNELVGNSTFTLSTVAGVCRCTYGPGPTDFWAVAYDPDLGWPTLLVRDGNLFLSGICEARVNIVSYSSTPGPTKGNIFLMGDVGQLPDAGYVSSSSSSFAVLASHSIVFQGGPGMGARGYYMAPTIKVERNALGNPTTVTVKGTVHALTAVTTSDPLNKLIFERDPDLYVNIPPNLPERPDLIKFHLSNKTPP